ncbi:nucleotide-binding protein, partial [Duganella levis]
MIIAVANHSGGAGKTIVANNLALLRARAGRRVLLVDT